MADFFVGMFFISSISIIFYLIKPTAYGFFSTTKTLPRITIFSFWLCYQFLLLILIGFSADNSFESQSNFLACFLGMAVQLLIIVLNSIFSIAAKRRMIEANPLPHLIHQAAIITAHTPTETAPQPPFLSKNNINIEKNPSENSSLFESPNLDLKKNVFPKQKQYIPEFRISYYDLNNKQILTEISVIDIFTVQEDTMEIDYIKAYCFDTTSEQSFRMDRLTYAEELNVEKIYFEDQEIKKAFLNYLK